MEEFLAASLSYPTVIFTGLLGAVFAYWIMVIVGAMGIDVLDVDGASDGIAEGATEAASEGTTGGVSSGLLASIFSALKLRSVPLTLVLSLVILLAWVSCWLGTHYLLHGMGLGPPWLIGTALLASSIIVAFPITSVLVRPLAHVLRVEKPVSRRDLVGKVVRIDTSRVDRRFGMAKAEDGGAGLIVQVRCDAEDNGLRRGSTALVVSYDSAREVYDVTPYDDILPGEGSRPRSTDA